MPLGRICMVLALTACFWNADAQLQDVVSVRNVNGLDGFVIVGETPGHFSGMDVAMGGDVNGDGLADLMIGTQSEYLGGGGLPAGSVALIHGSLVPYPARFDMNDFDGYNGYKIFGSGDAPRLGDPIDGIGDFNADGWRDLVFGNFQSSPGGLYRAGATHIHFGGPVGFYAQVPAPVTRGLALLGDQEGGRVGSSVAGAGDINGDGIDDVVTGAPGMTTIRRVGLEILEFPAAGKVYVVYGSALGFSSTLAVRDLDGTNGFVINGLDAADQIGASVAGGGDFNGDGLADIAIGAPGVDTGDEDAGAGYLLFGSESLTASSVSLAGLNGSNGLQITGTAEATIGSYVRFVGDVNADGFDDLAVSGVQSAVVFGQESPPAIISTSSLDGSNGFSIPIVNTHLRGAGDFNGDGIDDLMISDRDSGIAFVVFGNRQGFPGLFDPYGLNASAVTQITADGIATNRFTPDSMAAGDDLNGDGIDDVALGAANHENNKGGALVVFGNSAPFASGNLARLFDELEDDPFSPGSRIDIALAQNYLDHEPMAGVAVVGNDSTPDQGQWQFGSDGVTWSAIPTGVSDVDAQVIQATDRLRFFPAENFSGEPGPLTVRLWDGRLHSAGPGVYDITPFIGGRGGFSNDDNLLQVSAHIEAVNDAPSFLASHPPVVNEDPGGVTLQNWATFDPGPPSESGQIPLAWQVGNISNPGLFSVLPTVDALGHLVYNPAPDTSGTSTFDLRVVDNGGIANGGADTSAFQAFTITVNPVNDPPTFLASDPPPIPMDAGAQSIPNWAVTYAGAPDETGQLVSLSVTGVSDSSLFEQPPMVDASGNLHFTPAPGARGASTFQVVATDDGGVANGGQDTSALQQFTIEITGADIFRDGFENPAGQDR